jgi:hypothetical protein
MTGIKPFHLAFSVPSVSLPSMSEASTISQQGRERQRGNGRGVGRGIGTEVERLPWKVPVSEELTEREELRSRSHVVGSASTADCIEPLL